MGTKFLRTSASQTKTFRLCARKWWLKKVRRIEGPNRNQDSLSFGTALHGVCERWLAADDQGRDPLTGSVVDLYPPGWDEGIEEEGDHIKALVEAAISKGYLVRSAGRKIEEEFWEVIQAHPPVLVTGFIDLNYPGTVVDHKTSKSTRYLLNDKKDSERYLGSDLQMLLYAKVTGAREVVHNQFLRYPKDDGSADVRQVRVKVTDDQVEEAWREFVEDAMEMNHLKNAGLEDDDWAGVPTVDEGTSMGSHCNAFGGCPYIQICTGGEKPKKFRRKMLRMARDHATKDTHKNTEENVASFADKMKALKERKAPSINPPAPQAEEKKEIPEFDGPDMNDESTESLPSTPEEMRPAREDEVLVEGLVLDRLSGLLHAEPEFKVLTTPEIKKLKKKELLDYHFKSEATAKQAIETYETLLRAASETSEDVATPTATEAPKVYVGCLPVDMPYESGESFLHRVLQAEKGTDSVGDWFKQPAYNRTAAFMANHKAMAGFLREDVVFLSPGADEKALIKALTLAGVGVVRAV